MRERESWESAADADVSACRCTSMDPPRAPALALWSVFSFLVLFVLFGELGMMMMREDGESLRELQAMVGRRFFCE